MHAKSGLRVVLKWRDFRPDSVIPAVIRLRKTSEPHNMKLTANRSRFRLRSLFLAITVLAIGLAYFRTQYSTAYQQWLAEKDLISRLNESCSVTETKIKGTPWLIWLDSLTEDRIFLRATSVRVNNGNSAPLQEIFNELKNFKHLEDVMVSWQYDASLPRIEETIAEVEQQGKDALPHVEIGVFAFDSLGPLHQRLLSPVCCSTG